jgi:hypothetical protein
MGRRYTSAVDLYLILRDEQGRVLLGGRRNTGWADGQLALPRLQRGGWS